MGQVDELAPVGAEEGPWDSGAFEVNERASEERLLRSEMDSVV